MMKKKTVRKPNTVRFFKAWQKEFPNFYTPKLKRVEHKKDFLVSVSAGQGAWDKSPVYDATAFKFVKGKMGGNLGNTSVRGFKRLGGRRFKDEVKARAYAKKMLRGLK